MPVIGIGNHKIRVREIPFESLTAKQMRSVIPFFQPQDSSNLLQALEHSGAILDILCEEIDRDWFDSLPITTHLQMLNRILEAAGWCNCNEYE